MMTMGRHSDCIFFHYFFLPALCGLVRYISISIYIYLYMQVDVKKLLKDETMYIYIPYLSSVRNRYLKFWDDAPGSLEVKDTMRLFRYFTQYSVRSILHVRPELHLSSVPKISLPQSQRKIPLEYRHGHLPTRLQPKGCSTLPSVKAPGFVHNNAIGMVFDVGSVSLPI